MRTWVDLILTDPSVPPAEMVAVLRPGHDRLELWRISFKFRFDHAEIVCAANTARATISFVAYDRHLDKG